MVVRVFAIRASKSTEKKTAAYGAFVCFSPATIDGGEFMIADGAKILRDLDLDVAQRIYDNRIRISVSNLDFGGALAPQPSFAKPVVKELWKQARRRRPDSSFFFPSLFSRFPFSSRRAGGVAFNARAARGDT
jgi:hypothetical protein